MTSVLKVERPVASAMVLPDRHPKRLAVPEWSARDLQFLKLNV